MTGDLNGRLRMFDAEQCQQLRETIRTNRGNLDFRAGALEGLECARFEILRLADMAESQGEKAALRRAADIIAEYGLV